MGIFVDEVYLFGEAAKLKLTKYELGGKGYGLVEMTSMGLPVPPGMVITTKMCNKFFEKKRLWASMRAKVAAKLRSVEKETGREFGNPDNPLLVSVRSGAPFSMPGMMDTVLNLGMNDRVAESLTTRKDMRFAYDTYRRFLQLFGSIVMDVERAKFESILNEEKFRKGAKTDAELNGDSMRSVAFKYKNLIKRETGRDAPQEPQEQLFMAIESIFKSWWNKRATEYRRLYNISDKLGTAVNIVAMVYGNYDPKSGTGVAFTRDPSTGEHRFYGEVLINAQGEDVVAGIRTPLHVDKLREVLPDAYSELVRTAKTLEKHFRDMQDIEFTIESGRFYMLQTRNAKRTPQAAVKVAVDMVREGLISKKEALLRIEPEQLEKLFHKQIDRRRGLTPFAKGLPASPGATYGKIVLTDAEAVSARERNEHVILVRPETTPEDISGIAASDGILTSRGGMTSHAAVVTRGMGKPCVVGAEGIAIDEKAMTVTAGTTKLRAGDVVTIDGSDGTVYIGEAPLIEPKLTGDVSTVLKWVDGYRRLGIRANADTPAMVKKAMENGAEGIGLARTERMFNSPERLDIVQKMILADTPQQRQRYLEMIKPMQKGDFKEMFKLAGGKPFTIRLLDLPLHEFLPKLDTILPEVTELRITKKGSTELKEKERVLSKVMQLREQNPMMGQRGVRLSLMYKEIYEMQVEAMVEAAIELLGKSKVSLEIMVSQVAIAAEFAAAKEIINATAERVFKKTGKRIEYKVGTMIETPRAALTAGELAKVAEFFSFGTNDLTQGTFAFSRDDIEAKLMPFYISNKILGENPFSSIDVEGVGKLVAMCSREGKKENRKLKVGVCGEHGGDPKSIEFFNTTAVDYVSMSPYRVPVARLAAARAAIEGEKRSTA